MPRIETLKQFWRMSKVKLGPLKCNICGCYLEQGDVVIDAPMIGRSTWAYFCGTCALSDASKHGLGTIHWIEGHFPEEP